MPTFDEIQRQAVSEWEALQSSARPRILVGTGTCGRAAGALAVLEAIKEHLSRRNIEALISEVGCIGLCYAEPLVDIIKPNHPRICYQNVTPEIVPQLIDDYLIKDNPRPDLALGTIGEESVKGIPHLFELPMLKPQVRIVLRNCGYIDPGDIKQYIANAGYVGFVKALRMTPEQVTEEIKRSGLRGRGGAGFRTGQKWEFCRRAPGEEKYLICNADEGDPGAFMNRLLLEGDPHAVIEGMLIGAYAIGATKGFVYCRAEKPLAIERLRLALKQAEEYHFMGRKILDSDFNFTIEVREGAGAFVCGEETALIMSIEGKRGMPRARPPFPAVSGLWCKPTNINNVETWGNVPAILRQGAAWFAGIGSQTSKGTKTFALAGKVLRTGLIEVPIGTPLADIIYEIGGGMTGGKKFKAVLTGGPSGGCIPASLMSLPVDYESLIQAGSIMGSGGMVVADEDTCMVDMARFFLSFTQAESCGKCVPCRIGTRQMLDILERITRGEGDTGDIDRLEKLAQTVKSGSRCALGQTAPNPVLTTIRYFRDEYDEHITKHHCRAAVCKKLVKSPCQNTCPAQIDVPRYVRLVAEGKTGEAVAVIREKVPFPGVLGYVCQHFCESRCRRGQLDEAIAIRGMKCFAALHDTGLWKRNLQILPSTGKKAAVVGSGPAGMTVAYYLARLGHKVKVFEALPVLGGMMRVGIPEFRLPRQILDNEINEIKNLGVEIQPNRRINSLDPLFEEGYQAIFIGTGAHRGFRIGIEGESSPGVLEGVDFLRDVNLGRRPTVGERVAVVGGGNVAIDAARTALRLGARELTIVYRRTRVEMPSTALGNEDVDEAVREGAEILYLSAPIRVRRLNSGLELQLIRMELSKVDDSGRRSATPVAGSEFTHEYDTLIAAVGQSPDVPDSFKLTLEKGGRIQIEADSQATSRRGVFAGGDVVSGPASVIEAIASGRRAAASMDRYLGGKGDINEVLAPSEEVVYIGEARDTEEEKCRPPIHMLPLESRNKSFAQVELGYDREQAIEEAKRCLWCDLEEH